MKRYLLAALSVFALATLVACNKNDTPEQIVLDNLNTDELIEEEVGMANPLEAVAQDDDFLSKAGFVLDTSKIDGQIESKSVISDTICQVIFLYNTDEASVNCVLRGKVMDEYMENLQGIYDEVQSTEHFGFGLGEEVIDVLEIKYVNTDCTVYEFIVEDNSTGLQRQVSLETEGQISDDSLTSLLESVLWAMNAF